MAEELNNKIEPKIEDGKLNAFGLDISIADIVGGKIVDKWFSQLTDDDMKLIFKAVEDEIFDHRYDDEKFFKKEHQVNSNSVWHSSKYEDTPIWKITKQKFSEKYIDVVLSKVDEILNSEAYQKRATEIAEEIVKYATEGYKKDMMDRVRERLVNNTIDPYPNYCNIDIRSIIHNEMKSMLTNNRY